MNQYTRSKNIGFTEQQWQSLKTLEKHGINVNHFIRIAIKEKIARDWPTIKETNRRKKANEPDWLYD